MSSNDDCIFCRIVAGELPCFKVFEDHRTLAFMDINPANEGHALVIPKTHFAAVYGGDDDSLGAVMATVRKVASALRDELSPDGINVVQANGKGAAQSVLHFHMHVLPRQTGDELKLNWGINPGDMDAVRELGERLAARLD